jgi:regulator of sigma E protease
MGTEVTSMEGFIMAGQLLLGLTILVGLHEFGHFIAARIFGIRVNKFYIFFDFLFPLPNVLNFALWKKKKGDTEYGLGWFPLGGYVDIEGMIDETKDASQLASEPQPYEFRSKPAWQRLIVMLGGIIVNVILGVLIFWGITYKNGYTYFKKDDVNKLGIVSLSLGKEIGLKTGDKILNISGKDFDDIADARTSEIILGENNYYTVLRDGKQLEIPIPNDIISKIPEEGIKENIFEPIMEFTIDSVSLGTPAEAVGLKKDDKIVEINGKSVIYYHEFKEIVNANKNKNVALKVLRGADTLVLNPKLSEEGKLGFLPKSNLKEINVNYSVGEAFVEGSRRAFSVVSDNIKGFKKIFAGEVSPGKALSGPIGIARNLYGGFWDWTRFWLITGMLSMALAFMNLLPIPALDGGHALLLLYEMITGRKPSEKFMERTQQVGMVILLSLMVYILGNDIFKGFFK